MAEGQEKSYVLSYVLIVLIVGLALVLVLRPAGRRTEVRPKVEE
jgi:hypothetical protein